MEKAAEIRAQSSRALLKAMFRAAVDAAAAERCVLPHLPPPPPGRTIVVGAGKAAAAMAAAVEAHWPERAALSGLVVTRYGHGVGRLRHIEVIEAAHPVPDHAGQAAATRMLAMVAGLSADDLVLCLVSGGGSALLSLPVAGVSLADKQAVSQALLRSGAPISEMNCVRRHLSAIKGGRLAVASHPARVVSLLVSDVPGDDPAVIASGPTVADPTTLADARNVLARWRITVPDAVTRALADPALETPKPGDIRLHGDTVRVIATPQASLEAAAAVARIAGLAPLILGDSIEGEAAELGRMMAGIARQAARHAQPAIPPCVLISGGEASVTMRGHGRGGRNTQFLLALALALDGHPGIHALAADTDGIDGSEDNAGAFLAPDTLARAARLGLDGRAMLAGNDAYSFFAALGDLLVTGPTLTNVNDFRAVIVG